MKNAAWSLIRAPMLHLVIIENTPRYFAYFPRNSSSIFNTERFSARASMCKLPAQNNPNLLDIIYFSL